MAKIYIDQGHNPVNPNSGAEGNGYREQDLVFEIGVRTAEILRAAGQDVRLSRPTPETQLGTSNASSLAARVNDANAWGADYFISLHANASEIPTASGSEAYVYQLGTTAETLAWLYHQCIRGFPHGKSAGAVCPRCCQRGASLLR